MLKNIILIIATEPVKKNKLLKVDNTSLLFLIPLPNTWNFEDIENKNQNEIKTEFKYDQDVKVQYNIISVENNITKSSPK